MTKLPEMSDIPASLRRRALLRNLFMTGSAAARAPFLSACGDSLPGGIDAPEAGKVGELSIPPGPLSGIGALGAPDGDGMAIPEGFSIRAVARTGIPPVLGKLYPARSVKAALLWTETPEMMEISGSALDAELAAIISV